MPAERNSGMSTQQRSGVAAIIGKFNITLNKREKIVIFSAAAVIAVFIVIQMIIAPVFDKRNTLQKRLIARQAVYAEIRAMQEEYQAMRHHVEISSSRFDNRSSNFTLFSFLDRLAGETGVKNNIAYMRPSSTVAEDSGLKLSRVELKVQDVALKDLAAYLHGIETSENMVIVKRLSINKSGPQNSLLTAIIQVETIESA
jgi:general secretion pathway protein M